MSWRGGAGLVACLCAIAGAVPAHADIPPTPEPGFLTPGASEVQHLHFRYGPLHVQPGQNLIMIGPVTIEKPAYDGYVTRIKPDLVRADGSVPPVDVIHLHHGVFLNMSRRDTTDPSVPGERFFATGEEKTVMSLPDGYGYPSKGSDVWAMNHMVHNQTPVADAVYITYDVDFVPADSASGRAIKPVKPIWMDVQNGDAYPVFDVARGAGGARGRWTYPDDARPSPYKPDKPPRNVWTADSDGTIVAAAGHVHPGGLWTDLNLTRTGAARAARRDCAARRRRAARGRRGAARRRAMRRVRCTRTRGRGDTANVFRSKAHYWDPNGPVSWDMAMPAAGSGWKLGVRKGDRLSTSATYETRRASWYESMGIVVAYMAAGDHGADPFRKNIFTTGRLTHGHLPENDNHGGKDQGSADPAKQPDTATVDSRVGIAGFEYLPGNIGLTGPMGNPPAVARGSSLRFGNLDAAAQVFHTITACAQPCNRSTGISYPLADGPVQFDSGELGYGPAGNTAAANRSEWETPKDLPAGTYTYFCRIHPYMRGAFRVK
jgi:plastocyanin